MTCSFNQHTISSLGVPTTCCCSRARQNELYTSMKQKTMDHELMTRITKEAQEKEQRKFEHAKAVVARLEAKRKARRWHPKSSERAKVGQDRPVEASVEKAQLEGGGAPSSQLTLRGCCFRSCCVRSASRILSTIRTIVRTARCTSVARHPYRFLPIDTRS